MQINFMENIKEVLAPLKQYLEVMSSRLDPKKIERYNNEKLFFSSFIKPGDLVFDVGANIGDETNVFLGLGAKVVSVEPQERCIALMKKRFGSNGDVVLVNKGISDKEGFIEMSICDRANTVSTFSDKWKEGRFKDLSWNRRRSIPVTTLDKLIEIYGRPTFCKIDVEGYELNVLKGLSTPIKYISFEFTREFFSDAKLCIDYINSLGSSAKFNCYFGSSKLLFEDWADSEKLLKELEEKEDNLLHGDIYSKIVI